MKINKIINMVYMRPYLLCTIETIFITHSNLDFAEYKFNSNLMILTYLVSCNCEIGARKSWNLWKYYFYDITWLITCSNPRWNVHCCFWILSIFHTLLVQVIMWMKIEYFLTTTKIDNKEETRCQPWLKIIKWSTFWKLK